MSPYLPAFTPFPIKVFLSDKKHLVRKRKVIFVYWVSYARVYVHLEVITAVWRSERTCPARETVNEYSLAHGSF